MKKVKKNHYWGNVLKPIFQKRKRKTQLSYRKAGKITGIPYSDFGNMLNNKKRITDDELAEILNLLEISFSDFAKMVELQTPYPEPKKDKRPT